MTEEPKKIRGLERWLESFPLGHFIPTRQVGLKFMPVSKEEHWDYSINLACHLESLVADKVLRRAYKAVLPDGSYSKEDYDNFNDVPYDKGKPFMDSIAAGYYLMP